MPLVPRTPSLRRRCFRNPTWPESPNPGWSARYWPRANPAPWPRRCRVMGNATRPRELDYARYHERAQYRAVKVVVPKAQAARILLMLLLQHLDQGDGPLVFGIDETLDRGAAALRSRLRGCLPGRSAVPVASNWSRTSGLRWISLMWSLGHVPWAGRYWALPFLTVLAPLRNATTGSALTPPQEAQAELELGR